MMNMGRQFRQRQWAWQEELKQHLYTPVAEVAMEGFVTKERLSVEQAQAHSFLPFSEGTAWGGCWEYGWFRADVTLPDACDGRRVVLLGKLGGEQLYYLNGKAIGSIDKGHDYVTLTRCAKAGETVHLLAESYAGHGARLEAATPCPPERPPIPPTPERQCVMGKNVLAVWNEDAYQLLMDVYTLTQLLKVLPEKSLRYQRVGAALQAYADIADFELPYQARHESFRKAREALRAALGCHNGSTAPLMWLIGQSHIDLAWLWPLEDTYRKSVRTFSNQLTLLDEYPDYRYFLCEPALLELLKVQSPETWQRVKEACARGQILPEGGFYVECDTNLPSGESLIRQLQWGKRWFREELGVDTQVGWLPDCFGFSAALPQLLIGLGIPYFGTQKLQRADPECEKFPYHHFIWEGMDGSEVLGLSFMKDNGPIDPVSFKERWENNRVQDTDIDTLIHPFGYGDGGGGPTRDMVELSLRLGDLEGVPRSQYGGVREYFEHIAAQGVTNRWVGEMYLSWHRGVYTSQRRAKALMRRAQESLHDVEAMMAKTPESLVPGDAEMVHECWQQLLFCQFHDVLGGVGIHRVNAEMEQQLENIIEQTGKITARLRHAFYRVNTAAKGMVAYNTLPWTRTEWVMLDGEPRLISVPADGAANVEEILQPQDASVKETAEGFVLQNAFLRVLVDRQGVITSLVDLENGLPLMHPGQKMNDWRLYRNVQVVYDAWELDRGWEEQRLGKMETEVTIARNTPKCCEVRIARRFGSSASVQVMRLYASCRRVEFETEIDWHERHRMLKTHFESNILSEEALHEIQFGFVARPAHRSTRFASDRYEVCNHRYSALCEANRGFAVLNNGSYGISSNRGELALTLLRAPVVPDAQNNEGHHCLTYALYPFATGFAQSGVVKQGYALNMPLVLEKGCMPANQVGYTTEDSGVLLETIKPDEEHGGIILRLYNSQRTSETVTLRLPCAAELEECGLPEAEGNPVGEGSAFQLTFGPFKVRTFRARRKNEGERNHEETDTVL